MDRRTFLRASAAMPAATTALAQTSPASSNPWIARAAAAALAMQRRDWEQGILAQAFLEAGDLDAVVRLTKAAIVQKAPDGRLAVVISGGPTDPAMGGEAYQRAAVLTADPEIQSAVQGLLAYIREKAPRADDGALYHVFRRPEVWVDGFNGAPPFLAAMDYPDEALAQIDAYRKRLWNPDTKLFWHVWDDEKKDFPRKNLWGVGNGWAAAGLARVIRLLPARLTAARDRLAAYVRDLLDGCLALQRPDGLFHDFLDRPDTFVETNAAQMLAYAIYTGVLGGWLPRDYLPHAARMRAAARSKMDSTGYVQGVCGAPNFDHSGVAAEGQAFFIMMEAAADRLA